MTGRSEEWLSTSEGICSWSISRKSFALAYNLANFLRQLVLPKPIQGWTLTTLRENLIKIGAKVVHHSKYVIFQLAEVAVPRQLFALILNRIGRMRPVCVSG